MSWLFTNRFSATKYMKVKRMGITELLRRIWLFSANKTKSSESFCKQPTQLIVELNSSLRHIIVTLLSCLITTVLAFETFPNDSSLVTSYTATIRLACFQTSFKISWYISFPEESIRNSSTKVRNIWFFLLSFSQNERKID